MNKLLKLLNEYGKDEIERDETEINRFYTGIISKKFGFIKWLVDNDKIRKDIYRPIPFKIKIEYEDSVRYIEKLEDRILMELSIQDSPIEFLISILR